MKVTLALLLVLLSGCASHDEGELIGTMSIYRTETGVMVVSDATGDRMAVNFYIQKVIILE